MKMLAFMAIIGLFANSAFAQTLNPNPNPNPNPSLQEAMNSLNGNWAGVLTYKDYKSGASVDLEFKRETNLLDDGSTFFRSDIYQDGPNKIVFIYSLFSFNKENDAIQTSTFRKGKKGTQSLDKITVFEKDPYSAIFDSRHWQLIFLDNGEDDDRPANIKNVWTMNGDEFTTKKEVQFLDDKQSLWITRNSSKLNRVLTNPH